MEKMIDGKCQGKGCWRRNRERAEREMKGVRT